MIHCENLGAGVQSTTMHLASLEGLIEPFDFAIFADTGWEHPDVYAHLDALEKWGIEQGGGPIHRAKRGNIHEDVLNPDIFATIPAWTKNGGVVSVPVAYGRCPTCDGFRMRYGDEDPCADCGVTGMVPTAWEDRPAKATLGRVVRQCTPKYKVEPIEQLLRELLGALVWMEPCRYCHATGVRVAPWRREKIEGKCSVCAGSGQRRRVGSVPEGTDVRQWIGFSTDEVERATELGFPRWSKPRWPLLELGWTRQDCIRWMDERGWKGVAKSACMGCPFHDDDTWLDMADNDPVTFAVLVEYDQLIRHGDGMEGERFLHEARIPLDEAVQAYRELKERHGEQLHLMPEFKKPRRVRHCNPFGCRTEDIDTTASASAERMDRASRQKAGVPNCPACDDRGVIELDDGTCDECACKWKDVA